MMICTRQNRGSTLRSMLLRGLVISVLRDGKLGRMLLVLRGWQCSTMIGSVGLEFSNTAIGTLYLSGPSSMRDHRPPSRDI